MKMANWAPDQYDGLIAEEAMMRLEKAGEVLRDAARAKVPQWPGPFHGPYGSGKDAGQIWTARDYDNLLKTVRVVRKNDTMDWANLKLDVVDLNIWVIAGNYKTWYANQVEYRRGGWHKRKNSKPYLRPALAESMGKMKSILENGV